MLGENMDYVSMLCSGLWFGAFLTKGWPIALLMGFLWLLCGAAIAVKRGR